MNHREAIAALVSLPEVTRISVAKVKPKDVIVVEHQGPLSTEACARMSKTLKTVWPDNEVVVLTGGSTLKVVSEP